VTATCAKDCEADAEVPDGEFGTIVISHRSALVTGLAQKAFVEPTQQAFCIAPAQKMGHRWRREHSLTREIARPQCPAILTGVAPVRKSDHEALSIAA
jgi:hypothetical protein